MTDDLQKKGGTAVMEQSISTTHQQILDYVKGLKFRRRLIGGVDPDDVLKKLEELNRLYETALLQERARYEALLEEQAGGGKRE